MKSNTRLTLENATEGVLNATYELTLSNGESMRLSFQLPKKRESQTLQEIERAMLQRTTEICTHMLDGLSKES